MGGKGHGARIVMHETKSLLRIQPTVVSYLLGYFSDLKGEAAQTGAVDHDYHMLEGEDMSKEQVNGEVEDRKKEGEVAATLYEIPIPSKSMSN